MTMTPKATHDFEQGLASFRSTGAMLGQLYLGAREQGLARVDAAVVACEYIARMLVAIDQKKDGE